MCHNHHPLVSIIIPAFNYGHFIRETLESVLDQTYRSWECIVVDDGSTDNTSHVVTEVAALCNKIKYVRQANQGQPAALNTGLRVCRGEYIQLLDADDLLERCKFEKQVGYLERTPEVDIVYGSTRFFRDGNPNERRFSLLADPDRPWMPEVSGTGDEVLPDLLRGNIMTVNAPMFRRRVFERTGLFDEGLDPIQDWDYWIRCAMAGAR